MSEKGEDIYCVLPSQDALLRVLGDEGKRLESLSRQAVIKCLVSDPTLAKSAIPQVQCRLTPKGFIRPDFFLSYGDKYVNAFEDGAGDFIFVVFHIAHIARGYRLQFLSMWTDGLPLSGGDAALQLMVGAGNARHSFGRH